MIPVILFHAGYSTFSGGFVGVDVFFVISGYLITNIIVNELAQGHFSLITFYERRARRILPALFLVLAVSLVLAWLILLPRAMKDFGGGLISVATFVSNILFWQRTGYFDTTSELNPLLHTWSLSVEEQFYIFFPLLLTAIWHRTRLLFSVILVTAFVLSLGIAQWGTYNKPTAAFFLLPTRAWELLLGSFCALYLRDNSPKLSLWSNTLSVLGFAGITFSMFAFNKSTPTPSVYTLIPTVGTALLLLCAIPGTVVNSLLSVRSLVAIGLISYSAYLWHQPLFVFARVYYDVTHLPVLISVALIGLTALLAWISWQYVETPFRNRARIGQAGMFAFSGSGLAIVFLMGSLVIVLDGNLWRYSPNQMRVWGNLDVENAFVWAAKDRLQHHPFDTTDQKNVLVIGDSLSGDTLNLLMALEDSHNFEFSSLLISSGCGNLALPQAVFQDRVEPSNLVRCAQDDRYDTPLAHELLQDADLVILASFWRPWEAELVIQSLTSLEARYGKKFLVFGRKDVHFNGRTIIDLPEDGLTAYKVSPTNAARMTNDRLAASLGERFVEIYPYFCDEELCSLFDINKDILLHDGVHFSRAGVAFISKRFVTLAALARKLRPAE